MEDLTDRPSDISDQATQREEQFLGAAIRAAQQQTGPKATGLCLYCEEPLVPPEVIDAIALRQHDGEGVPRWCGKDCASDYEHEQRMRKIGGQ